MNERQLRQTLDLAFKDRAPIEYAQMKRQGQLTTYLNSLTFEAMQSIGTATERAIPRIMAEDHPIRCIQQAEMARKTAEGIALSQAIEAMPMEVAKAEDEVEPEEMPSLYEMTGDNLDYYLKKMGLR